MTLVKRMIIGSQHRQRNCINFRRIQKLTTLIQLFGLFWKLVNWTGFCVTSLAQSVVPVWVFHWEPILDLPEKCHWSVVTVTTSNNSSFLHDLERLRGRMMGLKWTVMEFFLRMKLVWVMPVWTNFVQCMVCPICVKKTCPEKGQGSV